MGKVKIVGMEKLEKQLRKNIALNDVKKVIRHNGAQLQEGAQREADFRGHYEYEKGKGLVFVEPSGNLKEKIELDIEDSGMTAEVTPKAEYSAYVELGTRFMDAQPYLKPAFEKQVPKFKQDMLKLTK